VRGYIQVATRDAQGKWGPPLTVQTPGGDAFMTWTDEGTALLGDDSTGHLGAWAVAGSAFRPQIPSLVLDTALALNTMGARSSDGQSLYFFAQRNVAGQPRALVGAMRLADGEWRDVLRFDEPSRPHSTASNGIAEYGGWLYFTLSDFQSDIWVASVKGLKK
jgi:hypothetical protein